MTVTVRWAITSDQNFPFLSARVPAAVIAARIIERRIAVAELDGRPVGDGVGEVFFVRPCASMHVANRTTAASPHTSQEPPP